MVRGKRSTQEEARAFDHCLRGPEDGEPPPALMRAARSALARLRWSHQQQTGCDNDNRQLTQNSRSHRLNLGPARLAPAHAGNTEHRLVLVGAGCLPEGQDPPQGSSRVSVGGDHATGPSPREAPLSSALSSKFRGGIVDERWRAPDVPLGLEASSRASDARLLQPACAALVAEGSRPDHSRNFLRIRSCGQQPSAGRDRRGKTNDFRGRLGRRAPSGLSPCVREGHQHEQATRLALFLRGGEK